MLKILFSLNKTLVKNLRKLNVTSTNFFGVTYIYRFSPNNWYFFIKFWKNYLHFVKLTSTKSSCDLKINMKLLNEYLLVLLPKK